VAWLLVRFRGRRFGLRRVYRSGSLSTRPVPFLSLLRCGCLESRASSNTLFYLLQLWHGSVCICFWLTSHGLLVFSWQQVLCFCLCDPPPAALKVWDCCPVFIDWLGCGLLNSGGFRSHIDVGAFVFFGHRSIWCRLLRRLCKDWARERPWSCPLALTILGTFLSTF